MQAEMLSYSRSRGLFAGVSLEGSTLRVDNDGNTLVYGSENPRERDRERIDAGAVGGPRHDRRAQRALAEQHLERNRRHDTRLNQAGLPAVPCGLRSAL